MYVPGIKIMKINQLSTHVVFQLWLVFKVMKKYIIIISLLRLPLFNIENNHKTKFLPFSTVTRSYPTF